MPQAPRDAIEEFLIRDMIDLTWEILRIRRVKAGILRASVADGVSKVLAGVGHSYMERDTLSQGWAAGDDRARKKVEAILTNAGMTIDEVTAKTLESKLDSYERLDRMLASLEARRNNALREIDRHRAALGGVVRRSIEEIEDADFRDVETGASDDRHRIVTTDRRQRANRANAKSSTGPKTTAGKARAAQNAFRHGLNVPVLSDPSLAPEVEAIARKISALYEMRETLEWARRIAEAQVDLNRVRNSRRQLITRLFLDPAYQPAQSSNSSCGSIRWFWAITVPVRYLSMSMIFGSCFPRTP